MSDGKQSYPHQQNRRSTLLSLKLNLLRPESRAIRPGEGDASKDFDVRVEFMCATPSPLDSSRPSRGEGEVFASIHRWMYSVSLAFCIWICFSSTTFAQSVWEVTPYTVQVLLAIGDEPDLPASWRDGLPQRLTRDLKVAFRATWDPKVTIAPDPLRSVMLHDLEAVTQDDIVSANAEWAKRDKVFLVAITGSPSAYQIEVREYDATLLRLGPAERSSVDSLSQVSGRTSQSIIDSFSPLVRIDRYNDGVAKTRLRAGVLMQSGNTAGLLKPGDVLLPFDRRVSSSGKTKPSDVRAIDWTYLLVGDAVQPSSANFKVVSGYKQPFRTKRNRRNQQLAIRARKTSEQSTIRLQSRAKEPSPLIGYEIHEKGDKTTNFLGYTNWRGELTIPEGESPIRTLLVRSGGRVTAKLPIVPGLRDVVVASMRDDRQRVEADGFMAGIQTQLIDIVAQRESLSARIRRLISNQEFDEARRLLDRFRDLPTKDLFEDDLRRQRSQLKVTDAGLRKRIDTMFVQTSRTLGKFLNPRRYSELEKELEAAQ